jgi:hypothetical protein
MRRSKEIHMVNISFIDMLAGALGCVLILFVIVPKVSFAELEKLKAMDSLAVNKTELDSALSGLASLIPEADYNNLKNKSAELQSSITALQSEIADVQAALKRRTSDYNNLAAKYNQKTAELKAMESRLSATQKVAVALQTKADQKPAPVPAKKQAPEVAGKTPDNTPGVGDAIFGIDPPLTIFVEWDNKDDDVHLYMHDKATGGWCFYQTKRRLTPFGTWSKALRKLTSKPHEVIIQEKGLVPGTYDLYVRADDAKAGSVDVKGFIAMKLPDKPPKKFTLSKFNAVNSEAPYSGGTQSFIGTLTVTADDIIWQPK